MSRRIVIAVSGEPGAGKTTVAKYIAESLGVRYVSNGELFRQIASERGVSLLDLHKLAEVDPTIDLEVDRRAVREAEKGGVVIDGHLSIWILSNIADLKLFFRAPLSVRAERVARRENKSVEEAMAEIRRREESNRRRGIAYYGFDIADYSVADLVVNTALLDADGVKKTALAFVREYLRLHPEKA